MKLKRFVLTLTAGACLAGALTACGDAGKDDTTAAATQAEATTEAAAPTEAATEAASESASETSSGSFFLTYNGVDLRVDMNWADVKDSLGPEEKPMEKIEPCGGGDYVQEMYFYKGLNINTLRSETITGLEVPLDGESSVLAGGKIKKGDTPDQVKEVFGEPTMEDEYSLVYDGDGESGAVFFYLNDGVVNSMAIIKRPS